MQQRTSERADDLLGSSSDEVVKIPLDAAVRTPPHWGRLACAVLLGSLLLWIVTTLANGAIDWAAVPRYVVDPRLLQGVLGTLVLTAAAMGVGIVIGVVVAVLRTTQNPVLQAAAAGYVWVFRAIPAIVQLLFWFNLSLLIQRVRLFNMIDLDVNTIMTPFVAALLGLGLSEGAYMAEIVRSGIEGVPRGQLEAAKSLGMTRQLTMRRIVLPQAARLVIPPTGNETINMLKYTSLAFVISYSELLSQGKKIYQANFQVLEVLFACSAWYLVLVMVLTIAQRRLERRLARRSGAVQAPKRRRRTLAKRGAVA